MKPLPNLDDAEAMLLRGKRSALAAARNETESAIRDAYTATSGCDWVALPKQAAELTALGARLSKIAELWEALQ